MVDMLDPRLVNLPTLNLLGISDFAKLPGGVMSATVHASLVDFVAMKRYFIFGKTDPESVLGSEKEMYVYVEGRLTGGDDGLSGVKITSSDELCSVQSMFLDNPDIRYPMEIKDAIQPIAGTVQLYLTFKRTGYNLIYSYLGAIRSLLNKRMWEDGDSGNHIELFPGEEDTLTAGLLITEQFVQAVSESNPIEIPPDEDEMIV